MTSFEPWDVIKMPFPYSGGGAAPEQRPALVIAAGRLEASHELLWVLMITSAGNPAWPTDVPIDRTEHGMPATTFVAS